MSDFGVFYWSVFSRITDPYFPVFGLFGRICISRIGNIQRKKGPQKKSHLDTFQVVPSTGRQANEISHVTQGKLQLLVCVFSVNAKKLFLIYKEDEYCEYTVPYFG